MAYDYWWEIPIDEKELPRGTVIYSSEDKIKCECGAHKTYGEDCNVEFHQDYCMLYRKLSE